MMLQPFILAIDAGTSRTSAATARFSDQHGILVSPVALGRHSDTAPSTIYAGTGEMLFGDAAERRGLTEPEHVVREVKRRVGDDVPLTIGERTFGAEELFALLARWVLETVTEREGHPPSSIVLTVPVTWGPYRTELVSQALSRQGLGDTELISEPEAAARHYESMRPLEPGRVLVVYDLGGGTFDVAVMRKTDVGEVELIGAPTGLDDLGGVDFDDAIVGHALGFSNADPATLASAEGRMAQAAFRRECVEAKESLSFDSEATIPALLGGTTTSVRVTRDEFESMIERQVERTVDVVADALDTAGVDPADVDAILLTGGSSRIPRIAQLLSERFDRPIAVDADPKGIIALGAARAFAESGSVLPLPGGLGALEELLAVEDDPAPEPAPGPAAAGRATPARRRWYRRLPVSAYAAAGVVALLGSIAIPVSATMLNDRPARAALASAYSAMTDPTDQTAQSLRQNARKLPLELALGRGPDDAKSDAAIDAATDEKSDSTPPSRERAIGSLLPRTSPQPSAEVPSPGSAAGQTTPSSGPGVTTPSTPAAPVTDTPPPASAPVDPEPVTPPADPVPSTPPQDPVPSDPPAEPAPPPATEEPAPSATDTPAIG